MAKSAYPVTADLVALMLRAGFTVANTEAGDAIASAVDEFERRTARKMIAESNDRGRRYDPPVDGWLDLGYDLATLTRIEYSPQGGTTELLTQNTDYWMESYDGGADAEPLIAPYYAVRFGRCWYQPVLPADRRSIVVTGKWGYATSATGFPEDAWVAMLHRGGALLAAEVGSVTAAGRTQRTEAGVQSSWSRDPLGAIADRWNDEFEAAVRRYRRPGL